MIDVTAAAGMDPTKLAAIERLGGRIVPVSFLQGFAGYFWQFNFLIRNGLRKAENLLMFFLGDGFGT